MLFRSEYYPEIYQYFLICDNFLINDLEKVGATIISDECQTLGVYFFCRECCGQSIFLDSVFIDIVINHIARIFFNGNYDLTKKHIHQSFAPQSKYFLEEFFGRYRLYLNAQIYLFLLQAMILPFIKMVVLFSE